jgi:alpha-acetolactate decarboxylase
MLASCSAPPAYQQWGSMREVLRDGNTEARVALGDAGITAETYGVGALAGLEGEITIDAGEVTVSRSAGADAVTTTKGISDDDAASMLFLGTVSGWHNIDITEPVSSLEVDGLLATAFAGRDVPTMAHTPFRIEGTFSDIKLHVIGGQCPIRARMHGEPMTSPAFELDIPQASATVVGIYAADAAGDVTHMGSDTHMHIIVEHDGRTSRVMSSRSACYRAALFRSRAAVTNLLPGPRDHIDPLEAVPPRRTRTPSPRPRAPRPRRGTRRPPRSPPPRA